MNFISSAVTRIGILRIIFIALFFVVLGSIYVIQVPYNFPTKTIITVSRGESFTSIARDFKKQHLIRSTILFRVVVLAIGGERNILAGDYYFDTPASLLELAYRLKTGDQNLKNISVTIPEGSTSYQIADILAAKLTNFDTKKFLNLAIPLEGYLFPETYAFFPNVTSEEILRVLESTFATKISPFKVQIAQSKRSLKDIITVASILEREAQTKEDWQIISGIIWKRLDAEMPLQVDATFFYERGKGSLELTTADLKEKSPYNTYTNRGLPPTPIANPGSATIAAALMPVPTPYWYYLSDKNGKIHYARTHDEHVRNKAIYLP